LKWYRPNEVKEIDPKGRKRPYYFSLPVLQENLGKYLNYEEKKELVMSLVVAKRIFDTHEHDHEWEHYAEVMLKRVFWCVWNLCEATDMIEARGGVRVSIDNKLRDIALPYIEACQFPMSHVIWFDSKEHSKNNCVCRHEALLLAIDQFERALHMDLSVVFQLSDTNQPIPFFSRVLDRWHKKPLAMSNFDVRENCPNAEKIREMCGWHPERIAHLTRFTNASLSDEIDFWNQPKHLFMFPLIFGMHRRVVDNGIYADTLRLNEIIKISDEVMLPAFIRTHNFMPSDILHIDDNLDREGDPWTQPYIWFLTRDANIDLALHLMQNHGLKDRTVESFDSA